jgi:hypothetical protein
MLIMAAVKMAAVKPWLRSYWLWLVVPGAVAFEGYVHRQSRTHTGSWRSGCPRS